MNTNPLRIPLLFGLLGFVSVPGVAAEFKPAARPVFESPRDVDFEFGGFVGERIRANVRNWLLIAPSSNPAMLQMFRDRDRTPRRDLVPWAGEFAGKYLIGNQRVVQAGSEEMNESLIHVFCLLYEMTSEPRYLHMAREIEKDWETPPSGDYVRSALAGKAFYPCPKPRWESLPSIQDKASVYRGPLLLTYDPRFDVHDPTNLPELDVSGNPVVLTRSKLTPQPILLLQFAARNGQPITLCDFASAGMAGNRYVSWLPVRELKPLSFSRENPLRAVWPGGTD